MNRHPFPILLLVLGACSPSPERSAPEPVEDSAAASAPARESETEAGVDPRLTAAHREQLRAIASEYRAWKKVDEFPNWAPTLCVLPPPPAGRISKGREGGAHGGKLYYLYARDRDAYRQGPAGAVGQTVVKEAWRAVPTVGEPAPAFAFPNAAPEHPLAWRDGQAFEPGESAGLFVLTRVEPGTPGTDDGWIYATFPPGSTEPSAAGALSSCMECHLRDDAGRLFGLDDPDGRYDFPIYTPPGPDPDRASADSPETLARLVEIAHGYREWGRVDGPARWAPEDCRLPHPGSARISSSGDEETHGRKLYFLYAKDRADYLRGFTEKAGQVLVKEAWTPELSNRPGGIFALDPETEMPLTAEIDGKRYETGEPAGLFVMLKLDEEAPGTDAGWVYATFPTGEYLPSASGRLESCMECHVREGAGRLFGPR